MIESVEIQGYRLLDGFNADFRRKTIVIGANASGKSTLMSFLRFVALSVEFPLMDVLKGEWGFPSILNAFKKADKIGWKLKFHKPEMHPFWSKIPLSEDQSYVYEVVISKGPYDQPVPQFEVIRMDKPRDDRYNEPFKYLEATPYRSHIYSPSQHGLVSFDEAVNTGTGLLFKDTGKNKSKVTSEPINQPDEVGQQNQSLRLSKMRFYNEYPTLSWVRSLLSNIYCYPGFDVSHFSKVRTQPSEIQPLTALHPSGENLGTVLHEILTRADYQSVAEDIREFLRTAYPFFDDIFAETTFGAPPKVLVRIRERGMQRSMELWDLSDGMLRFLCLIAALLNPVPPAFIAIDEPEVGLHPRLLPIVADVIRAACDRTQVLVTTHSPDLLNCFDIEDVAVMVRDENKILWQRPANRESLKKMLEKVTAESLGDLHRSGELEAL